MQLSIEETKEKDSLSTLDFDISIGKMIYLLFMFGLNLFILLVSFR